MSQFDACAWTGAWPFVSGIPLTLGQLVASLQNVGFNGAAVSPLSAILAPDPMEANIALLDEAARFSKEDLDLRIVPILNLSLPDWQRDLASLLDQHRTRIGAIRILPNYHSYQITDPAVEELAQILAYADLVLFVQVRILDERAHHPLMQVPGVELSDIVQLANAVPSLRILACGVFQASLATLAPATNISVELSSVESGDTLANALSVLGPDRLLLGTHTPIYQPGVAVAKVLQSGQPTEVCDQIASTNALSFFRRSQ